MRSDRPSTASIGRALSPTLFLLVVAVPTGALQGGAKLVTATALWMAVWWVTEAAPLAVTSMLPVATPPNAIVIGSERVSVQDLFREGFWLNLAGTLLVTASVLTIGRWLLPIP